MGTLINLLIGTLVAISVIYILLTVIFGSKSDAFSGASSQVRTTFRGKPGFDDMISKVTLYLGAAFLLICIVIQVLASRTGAP
ncbi:MAG: preprotein translocase subunit SecG [Fimbriimonadales bacterium]|nr:preprotein translocase subunit SecG [Fimbriimonadales bacterium]